MLRENEDEENQTNRKGITKIKADDWMVNTQLN